jgi:integrase
VGIKFEEKTNSFTVFYSKRHPITRIPKNYKRIGLKTKVEAKKVERELIIKMDRYFQAAVVPSWQSLVDDFFTDCRLRGISEKTLDSHRCYFNAYTIPEWGLLLVDQIKTVDILKVLKEKSGSRSVEVQKYLLKCIRQAFQYALDNGYVNKSPVPNLKFKKVEKIKSVLTESQMRALLNRARELESEWYYHWALALYTGMRSGELFALTWDKVSLESNQIRVDCAWNNVDGFKSTKSGHDRLIEIAPGLLPVIKELKLLGPGGFVLPRLSKWDKGEQARELRMFLVGMGLPSIRFHDLRASWATLLLSKGVEPIKVMKMGGWRDMKTMMIYIRKAGVDIKGATSCLDFHDPVTKIASVHSISAVL